MLIKLKGRLKTLQNGHKLKDFKKTLDLRNSRGTAFERTVTGQNGYGHARLRSRDKRYLHCKIKAKIYLFF
jgi:hypothetical protein